MEWYLSIALILAAVGILLLLVEFFFPTGGICVVLSLTSFASAVVLVFLYGDRREAVAAMLALAIGLPIAGVLLFMAWKRLALKPGLDSESSNMTLSQTPEATELNSLRGKVGKTVSPMRPAGVVEFDGRRVDALTEGMMLDANVWVQCVEVKAGKVIVRQSDAPKRLDELDLDDLP